MRPDSGFVCEGGWSPPPPPQGQQAQRPQLNLGMTVLPPTDLVGIPYYMVTGFDVARLRTIRPDMNAQTVAEISFRAVVFTVYSPDHYVVVGAAEDKARRLGWNPVRVHPRQLGPEGFGPQRFETALAQRLGASVPLDNVIQHLTALRTTLYSGPAPGWMIVWDGGGNAYRPCGLVYGMRGAAIGEPCGNASGCSLTSPPGGPCLWAQQALQAGQVERPTVRLDPEDPASVPPAQPLPPAPAPRPRRIPNPAVWAHDTPQQLVRTQARAAPGRPVLGGASALRAPPGATPTAPLPAASEGASPWAGMQWPGQAPMVTPPAMPVPMPAPAMPAMPAPTVLDVADVDW